MREPYILTLNIGESTIKEKRYSQSLDGPFIYRHGSDQDFIYKAFNKFCSRNLRYHFSLCSPCGKKSTKEGKPLEWKEMVGVQNNVTSEKTYLLANV